MFGEVRGLGGDSTPFEVSRVRYQDTMIRTESAGNQLRVRKRADTNGEVQAFVDEIDVSIGEGQLDPELRVLLQEMIDERAKV